MTEGFGNFSNLIGFVAISFAVGEFILLLPYGVCPKVHAFGHARRLDVTFHKLSNTEEIVSQLRNGVTRFDAMRKFNVECHIAWSPFRLQETHSRKFINLKLNSHTTLAIKITPMHL